ncbi:hypothetical protein OH460_07550 [Vibrio sp. Makdt]|uniref:hypothetical protein n=1 Tax=Vibrio sp. Makdt TaxID=2998828 RepID=UPI0022CD8AC1|nr:hypothetical protein [Vibrio sp. Makdt]MDA0152152.1 hypothetical protein [Vibrio sp. Makdt]
MKNELQLKPKLCTSIENINRNINHFFLVMTSKAVVGGNFYLQPDFDADHYTDIVSKAIMSRDISPECSKLLIEALATVHCECSMINKCLRKQTLNRETCKEARDLIKKVGKTNVDIDIYLTEIEATELEIVEIMLQSEKPNFKMNPKNDHYPLELHKAGYQDGYRQRWVELADEIMATYPTAKGMNVLNEAFNMLDRIIENFVISSVNMRTVALKDISGIYAQK